MDLTTMPEETLTLRERRHEYGDVYTYLFNSSIPIPYIPGQYAHVRLFGMAPEDKAVREFSFASAPHESEIWFGIDARSGSPYQKRLLTMQPGDTAGIFKIKSHMSWPPPNVSDTVMIAGGVGVTPFRSQLKDIVYKDRPCTSTLIHVANDTHLYHDELASLASTYHAISRADVQSVLEQTVQGHPDAHYYLAGSPGFVENTVLVLGELGITRLESDAFKGLSE